MKITATNVYVGPNPYAHFPVIRHVLELGELEDWPTARLGEDFIGGLLERAAGPSRTRLLVRHRGRLCTADARR